MDITLTTIKEADLLSCAELYSTTFKQKPWCEEWLLDDVILRLSNFLAAPSVISMQAKDGDHLIGFLIGETEQWNGSKYFYLKEICVAHDTQRKGVGKILIEILEKQLQELGITKLYLITQREGIPANFYSALGFSEHNALSVIGKTIEASSL
ncbi:MAG: GNAT family N-acetyltransferase [Candidatus Polarisedimenticolaceae bacterium]|nr:GNAT family N-acetyltransferase [Candidatus Polarisedimenticolaceae bacterium]